MGGSNIPKADGQFSNAPYFNFNDDKLKFNTNDVGNANENYGSASALLPKSLPKSNAPTSVGALRYCFTERIHPPSIRPTSSIGS